MKKKEYIRDKRSPIPKSENVSKIMSANRSKNTRPEIILRKLFWKEGLRGYRLNYSKAPGRPDIAFVSKKIAIFVNGCFWHRCPYCNNRLPINNREFWREKFKRNVKRDELKIKLLKSLGWVVFTIWECQIKDDVKNLINTVKKSVQ